MFRIGEWLRSWWTSWRQTSTELPPMKVVVGLGNPGRQYEGTRHNVGYEVLRELARRFAEGQQVRRRFSGETLDVTITGTRVLLLSPTTYMNRSGQSVGQVKDFYKLSTDDILVVCDDLNLPLGRLRFRARGSAGGHKGLADVIRVLGTEAVPRLRIGIGAPPPGQDAVRFVLSRFTPEEEAVMREAYRRAADGVELWVHQGIQACMNRYNAGDR
ncbi:MAG: peptidyl-tRNA hydrolase [Thermogutta sp.]|nr:MAG: peptidyl-tRNA hydrolase [Thermogutta sp.]